MTGFLVNMSLRECCEEIFDDEKLFCDQNMRVREDSLGPEIDATILLNAAKKPLWRNDRN